MPFTFLERLPLPSLRTYALLSILSFACAAYYGHTLTYKEDIDLLDSASDTISHHDQKSMTVDFIQKLGIDIKELFSEYWLFYANMMLTDFWCSLATINIGYCCLLLFAKSLQHVFFGQLRVLEVQHLKDRFWNFVFYKFIFVFGVLNLQSLEEILLWCGYFSMVGALHLLAQLCKDRFDYLASSPTTPRSYHGRILTMLLWVFVCGMSITICNSIMLLTVLGLNTFAFLMVECMLLMIKTTYAILRCVIHLWDLRQEGIWENRALYDYYSELVCELFGLSIDFAHHAHMLFWSNMLLSMASLVICMQMRYIFHEFNRRLKRHKNYLRVVNTMHARFPMAPREELDKSTDCCAICWEKMDSARKLPCGHLFHNSCLRSWLEQDTTCPTCRMSLGGTTQGPGPTAAQAVPNDPPVRRHSPMINHFFHFDGSRYVSWLPSFSVEVMTHHIHNHTLRRAMMINSQLDNMARQVHDIFPQLPLEAIVADLAITRSMDLTIENVVENRIVIPITPHSAEAIDQSTHTGQYSYPSTSTQQHFGADTENIELQHLAPSGGVGVRDEGLERLLAAVDEPVNRDAPSSSRQAATASRFSKSPTERESILERRKKELLDRAKRQYILNESHGAADGGTSGGSADDGSSVLHQRNISPRQ